MLSHYPEHQQSAKCCRHVSSYCVLLLGSVIMFVLQMRLEGDSLHQRGVGARGVGGKRQGRSTGNKCLALTASMHVTGM